MIKKLPLPIAGLMLSLAAVGNLIQSYSQSVRLVFGILASIIGILLVIKAIVYPKAIVEDLKNPIIASVTPTFSMALLILSGYIKPYSNTLGLGLWWIGLVLHIILLVYFTLRFIVKFEFKNIFTSCFIVYVGLIAASITAPAFGLSGAGQAIFWFGFISYIILLVLVTYRMVVVKGIPEPAKPLFVIYAAPASLCLVGYLSSFEAKSMIVVGILAFLSLVMYLISSIKLFSLLKLKFYPSFSAFTFPMVISAIAMKQTNGFLAKSSITVPLLKYFVTLQTIIAVALVLFVLYKYIIFIANSNKKTLS